MLSEQSILINNEIVLQLGQPPTRYRIQALSNTLIRLEREGSRGFLNNITQLVIHRDKFKGVPLNVVEKNMTIATLCTSEYTVLLRVPNTTNNLCRKLYIQSHIDEHNSVQSQLYPNGIITATSFRCCGICRATNDCNFFVFKKVQEINQKNCWLLSNYTKLKHNTSQLSEINEFSTDLIMTIAKINGSILWSGLAPEQVSYKPSMPNPNDVFNKKTLAWAVRDGPRFIPPTWGATPAPTDVPLGPLTNTSGFDLRYTDGADAYIFLIDKGYSAFRKEFLTLTGDIPLLPDWAFGFWFTWYHPYNQTEKIDEIKRFQNSNIPLDVASLDMGWRNQSKKYLVNTKLFPDMKGFIQFVHNNNQTIFFNDHPMPSAPQMSPDEIRYRYDGLTSILDLGLDFWWFDCHWGSEIPGIHINGDELSYVAWGERVYWDVMARYYREKRPEKLVMMLGCSHSSHPSNHRTPVWWTGDNNYQQLMKAVSDQIDGGLSFKPYVTIDCTGHHGADETKGIAYPPEVYARWVQFCSLGTIFRIHSSSKSKGRQPWKMGKHVEDIMRNFTLMRYSLLPTLIAAGHNVTETGVPIVKRLDLEWPKFSLASRKDQYLLCNDLLVAPIDPFHNVSDPVHGPYNRRRDIWIPPGQWQDAFTGEIHKGPNTIIVERPLETIPLYHRIGGMLITLANENSSVPKSTQHMDWSQVVLDVFPLENSITSKQNTTDVFTIFRSLYLPSHQGGHQIIVNKTEKMGRIIISFSVLNDSQKNIEKEQHLGNWTIRMHLPLGVNSNCVSVMVNEKPYLSMTVPRIDTTDNTIMPLLEPFGPARSTEGDVLAFRVNNVTHSDCVSFTSLFYAKGCQENMQNYKNTHSK